MTEVWTEPWFWPAVAVVIGLPVTLLVLTEVYTSLDRKGSRAARIVLLVRNYVAPVGALLILLSQSRYVNIDLTWTQVTATVFGFLLILVLLNGLNFALFVTAKETSWRSKVPSIFVDIVRLLLILVSVAVLFSVVWGTDIAGLFTALGIGSIVIGLSLQNAVGSVVSGLLLLFEQPFKLGDWLEADGVRGRIVEVNWRAVHIKTSRGIRIVPNASLAGSSFINLSRNDSPFEASITVKFATDEAPDLGITVCTEVAAELPFRFPGESASVAPVEKARYEVDIPIISPANNYATLKAFRTRLWYAARRADLHLDGDLTDNYNTPENVIEQLRTVSAALYLSEEDAAAIAPQLRLERYGAGEAVERPLVVPDGMRYVLSGTASLFASLESGVELQFALLTAGDVMGLTALTRQGVSARITAATDLAVLFVPTAVLDVLVKTRPRLARDIGQEIDNRLSRAKSALSAAGIDVGLDSSRLIA